MKRQIFWFFLKKYSFYFIYTYFATFSETHTLSSISAPYLFKNYLWIPRKIILSYPLNYLVALCKFTIVFEHIFLVSTRKKWMDGNLFCQNGGKSPWKCHTQAHLMHFEQPPRPMCIILGKYIFLSTTKTCQLVWVTPQLK